MNTFPSVIESMVSSEGVGGDGDGEGGGSGEVEGDGEDSGEGEDEGGKDGDSTVDDWCTQPNRTTTGRKDKTIVSSNLLDTSTLHRVLIEP